MTYWFMAGETIHGFPPGFRQIGSGYLFGLPIPVYLMAVFLALGSRLHAHTIFGHEIYAIGANPRRRTAVGHSGRAPAELWSTASQRRDGRPGRDRLPGAAQFGRSRYRRDR